MRKGRSSEDNNVKRSARRKMELGIEDAERIIEDAEVEDNNVKRSARRKMELGIEDAEVEEISTNHSSASEVLVRVQTYPIW